MKPKIRELRDQRKQKIDAAKAILDKADSEERELTADEAKQVDELRAAAARLKQEIERREDLAELDEPDPEDEPERRARPDPKGGNPGGGKAPAAHLRESRPFSLMRALRAHQRGNWSDAKAERSTSDALEEWSGKSPRGFLVPLDALLPVRQQVDFYQKLRKDDPDLRERMELLGIESREIGKVAPTTAGAAIVATNLLTQEFIELLRPELLLARLGARMIPGLVGDVDFPRKATGASAGWVATEGGSVAESQLTTDAVAATPNTVGLKTLITRRMLLQSTPAIEDLVRADIREAVAEAVDSAGINGTGAGGQPTGVLNTGGIGSVTTAGTPTWPLILEFLSDLGEANALRGRLGWAVRPAVAAELMGTVKEAGQATYLMMEDGRMAGYPSVMGTLVPAQTLIFGNWADLLIPMWGVFDAFPDPYTQGDSGGLVLRGFQDVDVVVRHAASFSAATDL